MKILILGASGRSGLELVREACARQHSVTVLVREATSFVAPAEVRILRGDVLDPLAVGRAVEDQDVVLSALGMRRKSEFPYSRLLSPPELLSRSMQILLEEMGSAKVFRLCAMSAAGVGNSWPRMNWLMRFLVSTSSLGPAYRDLERMESILKNQPSGLDWMAVRPTTLTNGRATGRTRPTERYSLFATVPRADIAAYMLDKIELSELSEKNASDPRTPMLRS